jgi:serpin B
MKSCLIPIVTVALSFVVFPAKAHAIEPAPPGDSKVAEMNNSFATDLYAQLATKEGNFFFSPASIQSALAMTWAGARGPTADEMAKALHLKSTADVHDQMGGFLRQLNDDGKKGGYELAMANALWGLKGYPFMPDYLKLIKKNYDGNLSDLDFAGNPDGSRKTINDWVAKQTHDRIKDLIPPGAIDADTRLVLTNAVYFKGKWDAPFKKEQTQDDDFTTADGKKVRAPFMFQQLHARLAEDDHVQVLELTYGKNDLAMRVYLPKKSDGLAAFEKQFSTERRAALTSQLRQQEIKVWLPRFTMESEFSMSGTLKAMGMKMAFDPTKADFKGMTSAEQVFISAVIHKAFVKVDEEGTEAAAATGVVMHPTAVQLDPPKPKEFKADHPFVFEIVHQKTGAALFMGRVAKP